MKSWMARSFLQLNHQESVLLALHRLFWGFCLQYLSCECKSWTEVRQPKLTSQKHSTLATLEKTLSGCFVNIIVLLHCRKIQKYAQLKEPALFIQYNCKTKTSVSLHSSNANVLQLIFVQKQFVTHSQKNQVTICLTRQKAATSWM